MTTRSVGSAKFTLQWVMVGVEARQQGHALYRNEHIEPGGDPALELEEQINIPKQNRNTNDVIQPRWHKMAQDAQK